MTGMVQLTTFDTRQGVMEMATKEEYDAAIARVANNPSGASTHDHELVKRAGRQAGEMGNRAREAASGES